MSETKRYVRYIKKQGVSGGAGYELEVQIVKGDSQEDAITLGKSAMEASQEIIKYAFEKGL